MGLSLALSPKSDTKTLLFPRHFLGNQTKRERGVPAVVDGFGSVFDLEDAAIGGECGDGKIVTSSYAAHLSSLISSSN